MSFTQVKKVKNKKKNKKPPNLKFKKNYIVNTEENFKFKLFDIKRMSV